MIPLLAARLGCAGDHELLQMREAISTLEGINALAAVHFLSMLVEAYGLLGHVDAGLAACEEARRLMEQHDRPDGDAFLHCIAYLQSDEADLLRRRGDLGEAETAYRHAIEVAQRQQAKSWELRAATGLARFWQ